MNNYILTIILVLSGFESMAQLGKKIGASHLMKAPDARSAGMGELGAATRPDEAANFWNPAKMGLYEGKYGAILGYTPQTAGIINGISVLYLAGQTRLSEDFNLGVSVNYFSHPRQTLYDDMGTEQFEYRPYEAGVDMTLSQRLSSSFSMGYTFRYIRSDMYDMYTDIETSPANAFAIDWGMYYSNFYRTFSAGMVFKNIGTKLDYGSNVKSFLPMNLAVGVQQALYADDEDGLFLSVELNKSLVSEDKASPNEDSVIETLFSGLNELSNYSFSSGLEFVYKEALAMRTGIKYADYDNPSKRGIGLNIGAGYVSPKVHIDLSYLVPIQNKEYMFNTLRVSLRLRT